jgi:hypothetical protein
LNGCLKDVIERIYPKDVNKAEKTGNYWRF